MDQTDTPTVTSPDTIAEPAGALGLRRKVLTGPQVLGQSVAGIGPTIGAVSLIPLAFADAGNATWLTIVLATVGILAVGVCITTVAGVHFSAGALYNLVPQGLGKVIGFLTGWVTILTMVFSGPFLITGFVQYLATFLATTHVATLSGGTQFALELICIAGVLGMAVLDIRVTTDVFLIIEGASMMLITVLLVVILAHSGSIVDHAQLSLHGSSVHGTLVGLVFLVLAFGGFESATVLGLEAREPRKAMRLAVLGSVVVVGIFLTLNAWVQVLGLKHSHLSISAQSAPLSVLANQAGVKWLGDVVLLGAMSSFFAAANSTLNYGPRVLFTMAHDGLLPIALGKTLPRTGAPYRTIMLYGGVWAGILTYIYASSANASTAFGNAGHVRRLLRHPDLPARVDRRPSVGLPAGLGQPGDPPRRGRGRGGDGAGLLLLAGAVPTRQHRGLLLPVRRPGCRLGGHRPDHEAPAPQLSQSDRRDAGGLRARRPDRRGCLASCTRIVSCGWRSGPPTASERAGLRR